MRYFHIVLLLILFLLLSVILPEFSIIKASHFTCGSFNFDTDVGVGKPCRITDQDSGLSLGSCTYDQITYRCSKDNEQPIRCIKKNPLDCGSGVTVCGRGDGYNCTKWCSDVYSDYTRPCEILRDTNTVFSDDFPGTGNGRNDNCYNGSRCINPSASGASCTQGSTNCICDTRLACTDYVNQCVINIKNDCQTNECIPN